MSRSIRTCLLLVSIAVVVLGLQSVHAAGAPPKAGPSSYFVFVGTRADGIYGFRFTVATGQFEALGLLVPLELPTWLVKKPDASILYTTNELGNDGKANGSLSSLRFDPHTGKLELLNKISAGGGGTTQLTLDKTGKFLLAVNYGSGQVVAFRIKEDGSIGERTAFIQHSGSSIAPKQNGPHAHEVVLSADNRFALVPDLGLDRIFTYKFDSSSGTLTPGVPPFVQLPAGVEPRHFAFHPNGRFAYLIEEIGAEIVAFDYNRVTGALKPLQTLSTLPDNFTGTKSGAEVWVEPTGHFLYAANRRDETLLVYAIDAKDGTLTLLQRIDANGKSPRFMTPEPTGKVLLVADTLSNQIVLFNIDPATGKLSAGGQAMNVPSPTHILFVPAE